MCLKENKSVSSAKKRTEVNSIHVTDLTNLEATWGSPCQQKLRFCRPGSSGGRCQFAVG